MGRELQKRKNRSSRPTVRPKNVGRTKTGKKKVNFLGNETIAKNWDRSLTLSQNYKRLGLSNRLNAATGGTEMLKIAADKKAIKTKSDLLAIKAGNRATNLQPQEVQVERDPETGRILRVLHQAVETNNPLNDPLNDIMDFDDAGNSDTEENIVSQLEAQAAMEEDQEAKKKRPRQQSQREEEWIEQLVKAHGHDTRAMFRDKKLNRMQQSEGDIARRLKKWLQKHE